MGTVANARTWTINKMYEGIKSGGFWPLNFGQMNRRLARVTACILCRTDFTPTLYSMTAAYVFDAYRGFAKQPYNAAFVKPLGVGSTGLGKNVFNTEEGIKFVGLAYYSKNRTLLDSGPPGELRGASGDQE